MPQKIMVLTSKDGIVQLSGEIEVEEQKIEAIKEERNQRLANLRSELSCNRETLVEKNKEAKTIVLKEKRLASEIEKIKEELKKEENALNELEGL